MSQKTLEKQYICSIAIILKYWSQETANLELPNFGSNWRIKMRVRDLQQYTIGYITSHDTKQDCDVDKTISTKFGKEFMKQYPSKYYAINEGPHDKGYGEVTPKFLKSVLGSNFIFSMYHELPFRYNGIRLSHPSIKHTVVLLLDEPIKELSIKPNDYRRILISWFDGIAYYDEVDTPESVDAYFVEFCRLSGCTMD